MTTPNPGDPLGEQLAQLQQLADQMTRSLGFRMVIIPEEQAAQFEESGIIYQDDHQWKWNTSWPDPPDEEPS